METLRFKVDVDAPVDHVWNTMLDLDTYNEWSGAFHEGSTYEGGWSEGDGIRFVGPNDDGTVGGLYGVIEANRPHEFVSVRYLGEIDKGEEVPEASVAGTHENYSFSESGGVTTIDVELEVPENYAEMMNDMWPQALDKIKELAEKP